MTVPGSNLLARASRLIALQTAQLSAWTGSTTVGGIVTPTYADPVAISISAQAVTRAMYEQFGLDFQRDYLMAYTTAHLKDLQRDKTPDRVDFAGQRYTVESNTDWQAMDGWRGSLLIRQGPTP